MNQMQIDRSDIETLLDALDAYEVVSASPMKLLLGGVLLKGDEGARRKFFEDETSKAKIEVGARRERVIMLKAKLLIWRDQLEAGQFADDALRPKESP